MTALRAFVENEVRAAQEFVAFSKKNQKSAFSIFADQVLFHVVPSRRGSLGSAREMATPWNQMTGLKILFLHTSGSIQSRAFSWAKWGTMRVPATTGTAHTQRSPHRNYFMNRKLLWRNPENYLRTITYLPTFILWHTLKFHANLAVFLQFSPFSTGEHKLGSAGLDGESFAHELGYYRLSKAAISFVVLSKLKTRVPE
jgi:hypothetical protein